MLNATEMFVRRIANRSDLAGHVITQFRTRLDADVANAFEWADDAMKAAASKKVLDEVLMMINTKELTPADIGEYAVRTTLNKARYPHCSTSPASNAMHLYTAAAWAEVAELASEAAEG